MCVKPFFEIERQYAIGSLHTFSFQLEMSRMGHI